MAWRMFVRKSWLVPALLALCLLGACGSVREAPQGITGVWQLSMSPNDGPTPSIENLWIEQGAGTSVLVRNSSDFESGTYSGSQLTLIFRNAGDGEVTQAVATKSGTRLDGNYTVRAISDNTIRATGTFTGEYVMHPADLKGRFPSTWGGNGSSLGFSRAPWNADVQVGTDGNGNVTLTLVNGMGGITTVEGASREEFLVRANVGGDLGKTIPQTTVTVDHVGDLFIVPTSDGRFALLRTSYFYSSEGWFSAEFEYCYPYATWAGGRGVYIQRCQYGIDPVTYRFFLETKDPGTGLPVPIDRLNMSSVRVADSAGVLMPLTGSPVPLYETYVPLDNTGQSTAYSGLAGALSLPIGWLPSGLYSLYCDDIQGFRYTRTVSYDGGIITAGAVDNTTMSAAWNPDNTLTLSWRKPPALTNVFAQSVRFAVDIRARSDRNGDGTNDQVYIVTTGVNDGQTTHSHTVPASATAWIKARYAVSDLEWRVQVRYANNGYESFRHYSYPRALPAQP